MPESLPLFPLGTVLLPGLVLPLHVFEERYRALVRDLLDLPEGAPRRFGVVAIRSGCEVGADGVRALHDVGCTAELRQVERLDDGRYALVTVGGTRFALRSVAPTRAPYLVGEVDLLDDDDGSGPEAALLAGAVRRAFAGYGAALSRARGQDVVLPDLPDDPLVLSYVVAATALVDLDDTQALLAAPDTAARLRTGLSLLERETGLLRRLPAVPSPDLTRTPLSPN